MTQALIESGRSIVQRVSLLECIPLALERCWSTAKTFDSYTNNNSSVTNCWNRERASFAVDAAVGAVLLGGAETVLVPASLVTFLEEQRTKAHEPFVEHSVNYCKKPLHITEESTFSKHVVNNEQEQQQQCKENSIKHILQEWDILRSEQHLSVLLNIHESCEHFINNIYNEQEQQEQNENMQLEYTETSPFELFVNRYKKAYTKFCIPVPASPLASKLLFCDMPLDIFESHYLAQFKEQIAEAGPRYSWQAWIRSALSCSYEGSYLPPIRLAEQTAKLLTSSAHVHHHSSGSNSGSRANKESISNIAVNNCTGVIWESAVSNSLTPRWLETCAKTAISCGVPMHALTLAIADDKEYNTVNYNSNNAWSLLYKGLEMGVTSFATCTLTQASLFDKTDPLSSLDTVTSLLYGCNATSETIDYNAFAHNDSDETINGDNNCKSKEFQRRVNGDSVMEAVESSQEYAEAVNASWQSYKVEEEEKEQRQRQQR